MLSAVVNTYNEGKNIERCLSSLSFTDEIILVDMGSSDDTCEKAKAYGARIYTHPYTGFVEPARNFAIEKAKGEWILIVDADEEVPRSLADYILSSIKNDSWHYGRIARKNIIFGKHIKHGGWWPDFQIRLFKKGHVNWGDKIHSIPETRGQGIDFPNDEKHAFIHYNYQSLESYIERLNRYTGIEAKELYLEDKYSGLPDIIKAAVGEYVNRLFMRQGYKDGFHGFVLASLQAFSEIIIYFKLWELNGCKESKLNMKEIEKAIDLENREKKYWIYSSIIENNHNFLNTLLYRIKRKFLKI